MVDTSVAVKKSDVGMSVLLKNVISRVGYMNVVGKQNEALVERGLKILYSLPEPIPGVVVRTKLSDK